MIVQAGSDCAQALGGAERHADILAVQRQPGELRLPHPQVWPVPGE